MSRINDLFLKAKQTWTDEGFPLPTQDTLDEVIGVLRSLAKTPRSTVLKEETTLTEEDMDYAVYHIRQHIPDNIEISRITPIVTIVYWAGDPRIKLLVDASLEDLPEFLVNEETEIRELALVKRDYLVKRMKDEQD